LRALDSEGDMGDICNGIKVGQSSACDDSGQNHSVIKDVGSIGRGGMVVSGVRVVTRLMVDAYHNRHEGKKAERRI